MKPQQWCIGSLFVLFWVVLLSLASCVGGKSYSSQQLSLVKIVQGLILPLSPESNQHHYATSKEAFETSADSKSVSEPSLKNCSIVLDDREDVETNEEGGENSSKGILKDSWFNSRIGNTTSKIPYQKRTSLQKMVVSFVNGIFYTVSEWKELTDELKNIFGVDEIRSFYNPSSGYWAKDLIGAGFELIRRPNDLLAARKLAEHLRNSLREVGPDGRVLHLAHSGGAILTYLAAKYHLTKSETDRIDIATFGGGRSITRKYFRGRTINYYAQNDPLVIVDQRANKLMKQAKADSGQNHSTLMEIRDRKHNTSFVFLHGKANNAITDHGIPGSTYRDALLREACEFHVRIAQMKESAIQEATFIRKIRKQVAHATGYHHFWANALVDINVLVQSIFPEKNNEDIIYASPSVTQDFELIIKANESMSTIDIDNSTSILSHSKSKINGYYEYLSDALKNTYNKYKTSSSTGDLVKRDVKKEEMGIQVNTTLNIIEEANESIGEISDISDQDLELMHMSENEEVQEQQEQQEDEEQEDEEEEVQEE